MLAGETRFKGGKLKIQMWKPFTQAPKNGLPVKIMRKSHKIEWARYSILAGRWVRGWFGWKCLEEGGDDPVTHYV